MSLRVKVILSHSLPIILLIPFFGIYLLSNLRAFYFDRLKEDLTSTGVILADALEIVPNLADDSSHLQQMLRQADTQRAERIQFINRDGTIFVSTEASDAPLIGLASQDPAVKAALGGTISQETSEGDVVTVAVPVNSSGQIGAVRLSLQSLDIEETFDRLTAIVVAAVFVLILLSLGLSYGFGLFLSNPLKQLAFEARAVANGDYTRRVRVRGNDEMTMLFTSFNSMVDQLAEQRTARQELLDNLAHELRRPISAMQAALEVLGGMALDGSASMKRLLEGLQQEISRLGRLTNHLTFAVQDKHIPQVIQRTPTDVVELAHRVVAMFEPEAQRLDIKLVSDLHDDLPAIQADEDALIEVFTNLVDNALKFTPAGGQVSVSVGTLADRVWVQVADTGMGLTAEEQARLFTRFYRGDQTRTRPHGMGLGLSISRELVQALGGTIHVRSQPDRGTVFRIELPL